MQALHYTRAAQLPDILAQRIVILDGAMGTMIQRFKPVSYTHLTLPTNREV